MKRSISLVLCLVLLIGIFAGCSAPATEPTTTPVGNSPTNIDWPKKNIQIIVPFGAGGDTDFNARTYAQFLTKELGTNVVVVNTTGNGGVTGTRKVMDSANDGYTVLFNTSAFIMNVVSGAADYGFDNFEVANVAGIRAGDIVAVRKDSGFKTMKDLVDYTNANPDKLKLAITTGGLNHGTALLLQQAGVKATLVDAGSTSERLAALLGGHLDIVMNPYGTIKDYLTTGELVALANPIAERPKYIADIPTAKEQGYDAVLDGYYFWAFPKGTDPAIVEKFNTAVKKISENAEYQEMIKTSYSQEPFYAGREEGLKLLNIQMEQMDKFRAMFK